MDRWTFALGSMITGTGVALGAFGAHALKAGLSPELLKVFETGVRYQMYHGLGLLGLAWAMSQWPERRLVPAVWMLLLGTVVFSGSLYLLVVTGVRWFGLVTPFGGVALIGGWLLTSWRILTTSRQAAPPSV